MFSSFGKAARTVLLISDQALYVYSASARATDLVEVVPWTSQNFEEDVATLISKECGNKPILILNDMVEQHYRKERIPRVSVLDKANVVNRKLMVTFPNYPVRAALPLKEKISATDKKMAGDVYIFTAVPMSDQLSKTLGAARQSSASIVGFCLLPVESSTMVKKLGDKLFPGQKARWTILVGQHQSGGLRQIVTKNGQLALTRMTPVPDVSEDEDAWVADVQQEFKATMSYLARFGFDQSDGLNFVMIANERLGEKFEASLETECNFICTTPDRAASVLGLKVSEADDFIYADAVHAAWAGTRNSLVLPMKTKALDSVSRPRQITTLASLLLFLGAGVQGYNFVNYAQALQTNLSEITDSVTKKTELDVQYKKEVKRKEDLGFDIQLIQSSLTVKDALNKNDIDALGLFYRVGSTLSKDWRFDEIRISKGSPEGQTAPNPSAPPKYDANGAIIKEPVTLYTTVLRMSFPSTTDAEKGNRKVEDLKGKLQKVLPDSVVKITKLLEDYQYSEEIVVETGGVKSEKSSEDYVAEIQIEKRSND